MEVDRVSRLEPLSRERVARWPDPAKRRRKFIEEFDEADPDADSEADSEEAEADGSSSPESAASTDELRVEDDARGLGFDALA